MDFPLSINFNRLKQKAGSLHLLLEQKKLSVAVAESLTGGLVSYLLTLKPGASQFFLGSVVCYSLFSKKKNFKDS